MVNCQSEMSTLSPTQNIVGGIPTLFLPRLTHLQAEYLHILRAVESLWTDRPVAGMNQPLAGHLQDCGPAGLLREDIRKIINRQGKEQRNDKQ